LAAASFAASSAFEALVDGSADLGMASRPVNAEEAAKLAAANLGDMRSPSNEHVVALDGIAVVVHASNPLKSVRREALRDVFGGAVHDWAALGAGSGAIRVHAREEKSGTYDTFRALVLGGKPLVADAERHSDSASISDAVAHDPLSIGFVGLASVGDTRAVALGDASSLPVYPTPLTVTTEDYLLARRLYLYTPAQPPRRATHDLLKFALSSDGQAVVSRVGFVDLELGVTDPEPCGRGCTGAYARATAHARRLSTNFRFRAGNNELDSRALQDIERLVAFVRARAKDGAGTRDLRLLGFSDASGDAALARRASVALARTVAEELAARGVHTTMVSGFGADMPLASNADDAGREKNRRVEVWLGSR
jgi:phosphate transport system substrate-binding protein